MFHEEEKLLKDAMKILISDDSLLIRKKLREELEKLGCQVYEAKDGDEAVEVFKNEKPDGIFMDIVMPNKNGIDAVKCIKEIDKTAKIIMLSSAGTSNKLMEALKLGAMDFIQKPYTGEQIAKALDTIRKEVM